MGGELDTLAGEKYINLETFKRDGTGVKTPIWFAFEGDDLVFMTDGRSWKVKRLRRDERVRFAACGIAGKLKGPWFEGRCRPVTEADALVQAIGALRRRYGLVWIATGALSWLGRRKRHRAYYRISPERLPR